MSAFIVSPEHIQAIVAYHLNTPETPLMPGDRLATILARENIASVCYRYQEKFAHRNNEEDQAFISLCAKPWENGKKGENVPILKAVHILKLIDSLEYQSCEHPEWGQSEAYKVLNRIRGQAIINLPGYDEAHWTI